MTDKTTYPPEFTDADMTNDSENKLRDKKQEAYNVAMLRYATLEPAMLDGDNPVAVYVFDCDALREGGLDIVPNGWRKLKYAKEPADDLAAFYINSDMYTDLGLPFFRVIEAAVALSNWADKMSEINMLHSEIQDTVEQFKKKKKYKKQIRYE